MRSEEKLLDSGCQGSNDSKSSPEHFILSDAGSAVSDGGNAVSDEESAPSSLQDEDELSMKLSSSEIDSFYSEVKQKGSDTVARIIGTPTAMRQRHRHCNWDATVFSSTQAHPRTDAFSCKT